MTEALKSGLWYRCREFVEEQSAGEWDDKTVADDADKLMAFVNRERADMLEVLQHARLVITHSMPVGSESVLEKIDAAIANRNG